MYDVIIIGAGIAGDTAAIYAARKKMNFLLITKELGGQFFESGKILNYPGIVETTGDEFAEQFEKQLEFNDIEPREDEEVTGIEKLNDDFKVISDKDEYETKSVIIATGSRPRKLDVPGEKEFANKGVTYCSICDGPLFADQTIAVIGGGNSALEGAEFTVDIAEKIYLLNIEEKFRAHEYLIDKVCSHDNVKAIQNAETTEILGDDFVTGLKYKKDGKEHKLDVEGVIIEIGRIPNTDFLKGFLKMDDTGHIWIDCQANTSVEGVYAAGDCASGHEYQYTIAAGQGCIALLKASRYLAEKK